MEQVTVGERKIRYDARGLVEPDARAPKISEIDGGGPIFDAAAVSTTRTINLELRWLLTEAGVEGRRRAQSRRQALASGSAILQRCRIRFEGSLGYFGVGLIDGPEMEITGRVGWSVAENMMSGVVADREERRLARRRRDPRRRPRRQGRRRRPHRHRPEGRDDHLRWQRRDDDRLHDAAGPPDHLRQRRSRPRRLDVRRGALRRRRRSPRSASTASKPSSPTTITELLDRKLGYYGIGAARTAFRKFVCAKKLWNYDSLEPSERKLVL